ncbi:transport permease protein [Vulcanimicrobium alpinum]|uniref:Transport permease protein n=1 Tax=Vulcanimicrobium alpinum TaxID=3016050 RepID=A0AAN2CAS5_UNVUL|nr:ABC transporter permease [Vulcanimicrobium alpinum]BDE07664.1 transport permease protein [Vulcanimicrobium alpinum]
MTVLTTASQQKTSFSGRFATYAALVSTLAARNLKIRYRGSSLGVFWSLSNPLLMTGVYTAIFGTAFAKYYGGSIFDYVLAVFVALSVLAFFSSATSQALSSIVAGGPLLNKIALPCSAFPVSTVTANTFQLVIGTVPLLMIVALLRTHSIINVAAIAGPLAGLILTSMGVALALAALYVYFRDLAYLYEVVTFIIYMTTPVFYPASFVPPSVRTYLELNPVAVIVSSLRDIVLNPQMPHLRAIALPVVTGFAVFALGIAIFAPLRRDFLDLL